MRKLLFFLLALILSISLLKSQNTNYSGDRILTEDNIASYVGEELILIFDTTRYSKKLSVLPLGNPFLKNYKKSNKKKSNVYFPYKEYESSREWRTNYHFLVGKRFKVLSVQEKKEEKYFELFLEETNEVLFFKFKETYSDRISFPFFVVKDFEYFKQTFINKRFIGVHYTEDVSHPETDSWSWTEKLFKKFDIEWNIHDTWICNDIKLDMANNPLIFVLSNNNQDINVNISKGAKKIFFEDKSISYKYAARDFNYKIDNYTPRPIACCDSKDRLNCYKEKIKQWAKIPSNQLRNQKYNPNFNFNDFEIVSYDGSFRLKDNKDTLANVWRYNLKDILRKESFNKLDELKYYFYDEAFKTAQENNKIMQIVNISKSTNSARGVSFSIEWFYYNTKKKIKYIYFTVVPYNAVGDRQYCDIRNYSKFTGSATGPITADARPEEYNWENAWYNGDIENLKIEKVEIEYLDGTSHTFVKELKKIISPYFNK